MRDEPLKQLKIGSSVSRNLTTISWAQKETPDAVFAKNAQNTAGLRLVLWVSLHL
jgi:hypothetical protein